MWILFTCEKLRALRFKSSCVFLKRPQGSIPSNGRQGYMSYSSSRSYTYIWRTSGLSGDRYQALYLGRRPELKMVQKDDVQDALDTPTDAIDDCLVLGKRKYSENQMNTSSTPLGNTLWTVNTTGDILFNVLKFFNSDAWNELKCSFAAILVRNWLRLLCIINSID